MKNISKHIVTLLIATFFVTACVSATTTNKEIATVENTPTLTASPTTQPTVTSTPSATPTPAPTNRPDWVPKGAIAGFGMGSDGQAIYSKYSASISGNGNAVIIGDTLMRTNEFTNISPLDVHKICQDPKPPTSFMDNEGKYIYLRCGENKMMVAELATMKVVSSYDRPLNYKINTDPQSHPWADNRVLLALMYENPSSSPVKYRIEIWDPLQNNKISTLDVNIPEFKTSASSFAQIAISPHSKYLVVLPPDGKKILSYDIDSGALIQSIRLNTPRPLALFLQEGVFFDDDGIFFIRHANFVEAYSIESGKFIQKIFNLKLIKGNKCETFCPDDKNNFAYFSKTKIFVNYFNTPDINNNMNITFNFYDLESGKKTSTTSIQLPYKLQNGEKADRTKQVLSIGLINLPPEANGNTAVVGATLHPSKNIWMQNSTIYVVDIPTNTILKSYTWQHGGWNISFLTFNNFLLANQSPDPFYSLWDISTP
jgi:hypothetical protein